MRFNPCGEFLMIPIVPLSTAEQRDKLAEQFKQATEVLRRLRPDVFNQAAKKEPNGHQ
mgnify:CR=1 FL=1